MLVGLFPQQAGQRQLVRRLLLGGGEDEVRVQAPVRGFDHRHGRIGLPHPVADAIERCPAQVRFEKV